jgi:DNA-binding transcriptional LysR family regulator
MPPPRGELRINAVPSFGILQLSPAIADFTVRFPAISVELTLSERPVDLIAECLDVAVRVEEMPDSSLIARQLAPCLMVVCGEPGWEVLCAPIALPPLNREGPGSSPRLR